MQSNSIIPSNFWHDTVRDIRYSNYGFYIYLF